MITFTRTTQTYNPSTDETLGTVTTVTGEAMQVTPSGSDLERFRAADLVLTRTIMLLFTPSTYGDNVAVGDRVTWPPDSTGVEYTVRDVNPLAPDGVTILTRVACSR